MKRILVLGDSHSRVFKFTNKKIHTHNKENIHNQIPISFLVKYVSGATAYGIRNENSKSNALQIFKNEIERHNNIDYVCIMLGEVDCGFLIWTRSKYMNIPINEQLNKCIENLINFIKDSVLSKYKNNNIIILGAPLPVIKDQTDKRFLNGDRAKVDIPLKDRTGLTLQYNDLLKKECNKLGIHFIDITDNILNKSIMEVDKQYLNKNPFDHHLDHESTYEFWLDNILQIVKNNK